MGGYWQEKVSVSDVADGAGAGTFTAVINVPFRSGFLNAEVIDQTSGDATDFGFNIYEADNAGTPYTTETNTSQVDAVASGTRTEYNVRDKMKFFVADATEGTDNQSHGRSAITIYVSYAGATGSSTVVFGIRLGGIGVS
jgi:hypothetical protein